MKSASILLENGCHTLSCVSHVVLGVTLSQGQMHWT